MNVRSDAFRHFMFIGIKRLKAPLQAHFRSDFASLDTLPCAGGRFFQNDNAREWRPRVLVLKRRKNMEAPAQMQATEKSRAEFISPA